MTKRQAKKRIVSHSTASSRWRIEWRETRRHAMTCVAQQRDSGRAGGRVGECQARHWPDVQARDGPVPACGGGSGGAKPRTIIRKHEKAGSTCVISVRKSARKSVQRQMPT